MDVSMPSEQELRVMNREMAAEVLGRQHMESPEVQAMLAKAIVPVQGGGRRTMTQEEMQQYAMESGRMAHDQMTGIGKPMFKDRPEAPWPMAAIGREWAEELSRIPHLKTISPALAKAVAEYLGTASG